MRIIFTNRWISPFAALVLQALWLAPSVCAQTTASVIIQGGTALVGTMTTAAVVVMDDISSLGALDIQIKFESDKMELLKISSSIATPSYRINPSQGTAKVLLLNPDGLNLAKGGSILELVFQVKASASNGSAEIAIVPEPDRTYEWYQVVPPVPPREVPFALAKGIIQIAGAKTTPTLSITPAQRQVILGEGAALDIVAANLSAGAQILSVTPDLYGVFKQILQVGDTLTAQFQIDSSKAKSGRQTLVFTVGEASNPSQVASQSVDLEFIANRMDDLVLSQGFGGKTFINIRNYDSRQGGLTSILRSHNGLSGKFLKNIGGGDNRDTYVSAGDINQDGKPDLVVSFGPIVQEATFPNIVVPRDAVTGQIIGHSFHAFPTGHSLPTQYNGGELRTVVGDFIGSGTPQIAVAQGLGGNGIVRLFQYTGKPAPNSYPVVNQFEGLVAGARSLNASGGLTLASGDLDGDNRDELIVGQTFSRTSVTLFHVLDLDAGGSVERRVPYAAFLSKFRGNGGINLAVADLNGDGTQEIVAASQGNTRDFGDDRDKVPLNLITVIQPLVENGQVTGFMRPQANVVNTFPETINPSGCIHIASIEIDGNPANGSELVLGSGSLYAVNGYLRKNILPAAESRYVFLKLKYNGGAVQGVEYLLSNRNGFRAFINAPQEYNNSVWVTPIQYRQ